jgi:hypothetical protein
MSDKKDLTQPSPASSGASIDRFLDQARHLPTEAAARPRLIFALDATMSRQPTWDLACRVHGEMFEAASSVGGLSVQLVYFRGYNECRASGWVLDPQALTRLMTRIECRGGHTQIRRVLRHVAGEARRSPVKVLVYVGDAVEEPADDLCALAGELGLLGIKAFMFHEGRDSSAGTAFREIARLTGGAYARFDAQAPHALRDLLRAAAAYAARGVQGLTLLSRDSDTARRLLVSIQEHSG